FCRSRRYRTMKAKWPLTIAAVLFLAGCEASLPDAPPLMDAEAEKVLVEKNLQIEIDSINSDSQLSPAEKEKKIKQAKKGSEGYMKAFMESKRARDEQYPPG